MENVVLNEQTIKQITDELSKRIQINVIDPPEFFQIDLLKPLKDFVSWMTSQVVSLIESIATIFKKEIVERIVNGLKWLFDEIINFIKNAFLSIFNWLKDNLAPTNPETVITKMASFYGFATVTTFGINAMLSVMQTSIAGSGLNLDPITRFVNNAFDPKMITSITLGILFEKGIEQPMRYWANSTFRPMFPSPEQAWLMWRCGYIDYNTYIKIYRYVGGWPDEFRKGFEEVWDTNLSMFDLFRVARAVSVPLDWITRKLIESGFEDEDIPYITKAILREPVRDELEKVTSDLYILYAEGWITRTQLEQLLTQMEFTKDEIYWRLIHADYLRFRKLKNDKAQLYILMFRKDLIDIQKLKSYLLNLGMDVENVNIICDTEMARKGLKVVYLITQAVPTREMKVESIISYNISG